ncbi:MAG: hypothetical protein ACJAZ2_001482 [Glaciecola sp.]
MILKVIRLDNPLNIKLESVIQEMLFNYECVVIPQFGGFLSHYQAAKILKDKNLILPPSKSLTFNVLLKANDGLLAQELVTRFNVSYKEAIQVISLQVDSWQEILSNGGKVSIPGVGKLNKNKKDTILFVQDLNANLLNDAYGLGTLKAQVLKKDGITGKIKEEYIQRQSSPSFNHKVKKIAAGGSIAAILLVLAIWSYLNFDMVQHQAESLGVFVSGIVTEEADELKSEESQEDNEFDSDKENTSNYDNRSSDSNDLNTDETITSSQEINEFNVPISETRSEDLNLSIEEDINKNNDELSSDQHRKEVETKIDNTEVQTNDSEASSEEIHDGKYIIVAGCFRSGRNATNFVNQLKALGYEAHLSGYSAKGLHRVAYGSYDNQSDAIKSMRWIQSIHNAQAWMTTR